MRTQGDADTKGPDDRTHLVVFQLHRSTKLFTQIALGAGLLCLALTLGLVVLSLRDSDASAPPTPTSNQAATAYLSGVESVKNQEWDEAQRFFEAARAADPSLDVSPQLERLERESAAKRAYLSALQAIEAQDLPKAQALVEGIPERSVYQPQAQDMLGRARRKRVQELMETAQGMAAAQDVQAAQTTLATLLLLSPGHAEAKDLLQSLEAMTPAPEEEPEEPEAQNAQANQSPEKPEVKEERRKPSQTVRRAPADPLDQGRASYKRKRYKSAVRAFKQGGKEGKELAASVQIVEDNWDAGLGAIKADKWDLAVLKLEHAKGADGKLGKAHSRQINEPLAQAYGKSGLDLLKRKSYLMARKRLMAGRRLSKSEPSLQVLESSLERTAQSLYIRAANLKRSKPAEAKEISRTIMLMTPTSSPTHKKAKKILLEL